MDIHTSVAQRHLLFYVVILFLVTACGGGGGDSSMGLQDESNVNSPGVSLSIRAISTPPGITEAFCVAIEVGAADMATIVSNTHYPAGTPLIETVVPNIPVGSDRTISMGIFENNICGDLAAADWFGQATGVVINNSDVTIVNIALARPRDEGIGSIVIRGDRTLETVRLHGEVITADTMPIPDATCRIFEDGNLIGNVTSGNTAATLGVLDTDVQVGADTNQLTLVCGHANFKLATKHADRVVNPPPTSTFVATVIMEPGVSVGVLESTNERLVVQVQLPAIQLAKVDTAAGQFDRIKNQQGAFTMRGGGVDNLSMPEIPVLSLFVALPVGVDEAGTDIVSIEPQGEAMTMDARLFPIQPPARDARGPEGEPQVVDDESFRFDRDRYLKAGSDMKQVMSFMRVGGNQDVNVYELKVPLVNYDPQAQKMSTVPTEMISLNFTRLNADLKCFMSKRTADGFAMDDIDNAQEREADIVASLALNRELFAKFSCIQVIKPVLFGSRLVIITPPDLKPAADALRAHKIARGISTIVATTDTTGTTAASIKSYLSNAYNNWFVRPKWVLLMGDAELIPTHYGQQNFWDAAKNSGDIYYGQLTGDVMSIPVFGIGRFPVDTLAQAQQMVDNVVAYENHPPSSPLFGGSYYSRLAFASEFQDDGAGAGNFPLDGKAERGFAQTTEEIRNYLKTKNLSVERIYRTDPLAANPLLYNDGTAVPAELRKPTFPWTGNSTDIINATNNGASILYHRDHGWWTGWGTPSFSTTNLSSIGISNNEFPVVFSINCASGIFDNETDDVSYGTSSTAVYWGETFVRKSDGAIAVIGDSRSSQTWVNNDMARGLFDAVWPAFKNGFGPATSIRKLGDVLNHAKAFVKAQGWDAANERQELKIYNLVGDPTAEVKTRPPRNIFFGELVQEAAVWKIPVIPEPCLTCPPFELEQVAVVAQDLKGNVLARGLLHDGAVDLDVGDFQGEFMLTASGSDVVPTQTLVGNVIR